MVTTGRSEDTCIATGKPRIMKAAANRKPKPRSNSAQTEEHRKAILDAAAQCFMRDGFESTTIDDVANEMGATKGLIYYSFRSKSDLFFAVYEKSITNGLEHLLPLARGAGTGLERLKAVCEKHVVVLMETVAYHVVTRMGVELLSSKAMKPVQQQKLRELVNLRDEYERLFFDLVRDGIEDGSIRPVDASLVTRTLLGAVNSVSMWYRPRSNESAAAREKLARQIVDSVIFGLAVPDRQPEIETSGVR